MIWDFGYLPNGTFYEKVTVVEAVAGIAHINDMFTVLQTVANFKSLCSLSNLRNPSNKLLTKFGRPD